MNKLGIAIAFLAGVGLGGFATYKFVKEKYEKIAQEEIDSVKERYSGKAESSEERTEEEMTQKKEAEMARQKPDINEYAKMVSNHGYTNYSNSEVEKPVNSAIEYISPDEFGDDEDYDKISLTYYSDGILTDDCDEVVEDFVDIVGNFTTHFGEFEDDAVYVRNTEREAYYEILRDYRKFADISTMED